MELLVIEKGKRRLVPTKQLLPGKEGNLQTLAELLPIIRRDALDPELRRSVLELIANCPNEFNCIVGKLFEFAKSIKYVRDPLNAERIADAATTIAEKAGDCGDKSGLLAAMLGSIGYLARLLALNFYNDLAVHGYDHLLVQVQDDAGAWQSLDPTPGYARPNWEPEAPVRTVFEIWGDGNEKGGQDVRAPSGIAGGPFDALIAQGIQIGTQLAAGAVHNSQVSHAQQAELGARFDALAGQVTALFNQIQAQAVITEEDLNAAIAGYAQLAQVAQQYPTSYITEQWTSNNYKPAYEARLHQIANAIQEGGITGAGGTPAVPVLGGVLPASVSSLFTNPIAWVAVGVLVLGVLRPR